MSSPKAAVAWARDYCSEKAKHAAKLAKEQAEEDKLENQGMRIGVNYFTTRPTGLLSAHGFVKDSVSQIKLAYGLDDNDAAVKYIENYCQEQRRKRRSVLALRVIASLDPEIIDPYTKDMLDIDDAMVAGVEATFKAIAEQYYPGDSIGYFMGLHHDRLTTLDPNPRRPGKKAPKPSRLEKPHLHVHIFVLPWTARGKRISISNHNYPNGMAMPAIDMLDEARVTFDQQARLSIATLPGPINEVFLTKEWNALARLAAQVTIQDFRTGQEMKPAAAREFAINRFGFYLRALDKDRIKRRLKERGDRVQQMIKEKKTLADAETYALETLESLRPGFDDRSTQLKQLRDAYRASIRKPNVSIHLLQGPKAVLTTPVDLGRNFADDLKSIFKTMDMRRKGSRITLLSDVAEAELIQASVRGVYPQWVSTLEKSVASVLPNHQLLEKEQAYPVEQREGMEAVGLEPGAPPAGQDPFHQSCARRLG